MRELLLQRIEQIKEKERNFEPSNMRWKTFTIPVGITRTEYPVQHVNFHQLEDHDLLLAFERIIRRHYTQM